MGSLMKSTYESIWEYHHAYREDMILTFDHHSGMRSIHLTWCKDIMWLPDGSLDLWCARGGKVRSIHIQRDQLVGLRIVRKGEVVDRKQLWNHPLHLQLV